MEICAFNKNHIMKKSLLAHYLKCHRNDYKKSKDQGWYCINNPLNVFGNKEQKEKHDKDCEYCQNNNREIYEEEISKYGNEIIKNKIPKDKIEIKFPKFDFDLFIKKIDENKYIKKEYFHDYIEDEKNKIY